MIGEMQVVLDNSWFSAHLVDLLYNAGALDSFEDTNCLQLLRESLLRDYALCLFSHPSLWNVGIIYLDQVNFHNLLFLFYLNVQFSKFWFLLSISVQL